MSEELTFTTKFRGEGLNRRFLTHQVILPLEHFYYKDKKVELNFKQFDNIKCRLLASKALITVNFEELLFVSYLSQLQIFGMSNIFKISHTLRLQYDSATLVQPPSMTQRQLSI